MRGYFGVAVYQPKTENNVGTLYRSARLMGAVFLAQIGRRFRYQCSDTLHSERHVPMLEYQSFEDFFAHLPYDCRLVGVELDDAAKELTGFRHPERAVYLLGAEDRGLSREIMSTCHELIRVETGCLNVAVAGSIVLYERCRYFNRLQALSVPRPAGRKA